MNVIKEVRKLSLEPEDIILVKVVARASKSDLIGIKEQMISMRKDYQICNRFLIILDNMDLEVINKENFLCPNCSSLTQKPQDSTQE